MDVPTEIRIDTYKKQYKKQEEGCCDNDKCQETCCKIICFSPLILGLIFFLVGSFLFPILGGKTDCGFRSKSTVKMIEYNGTVINSIIKQSEKYTDDNDIYYDIYNCYTYINLETEFLLCKIYTYSGSNLTKCIDSQIKNGTKINVFTTKKTDSCHLQNLSHDCDKSEVYFGLGVASIVITIISFIVLLCFAALSNCKGDVCDGSCCNFSL
jgi:hypothetical protein